MHSVPLALIPHQRLNLSQGTWFTNLPDFLEDDYDSDYISDPQTPVRRAPALSDIQKTHMTLDFMQNFNWFSFRKFAETFLSSEDGSITNSSSLFLTGDSVLSMMELLWQRCGGLGNHKLTEWVVKEAASACDKEASWLSDHAAEGPHLEDAQFLHVSSQDINVDMINDFWIHDLGARYNRVTPSLQVILKAIIAKDKKKMKPGSCDQEALFHSHFNRFCGAFGQVVNVVGWNMMNFG